MWFLVEKIQRVKESQSRHVVEVREMETKRNKALEELRVDLVQFLPEESSDVIVRDIMGKFFKLREKEKSLGEVLKLRMQYKKEVTAAIEKIRYTQKSTDMQRWHNKAKKYV